MPAARTESLFPLCGFHLRPLGLRPLLSGSRVTARDSFLPQTEDDVDRALHGALRYGGAVDIARHHPMRLERCLQHQHRDRQLRAAAVASR